MAVDSTKKEVQEVLGQGGLGYPTRSESPTFESKFDTSDKEDRPSSAEITHDIVNDILDKSSSVNLVMDHCLRNAADYLGKRGRFSLLISNEQREGFERDFAFYAVCKSPGIDDHNY